MSNLYLAHYGIKGQKHGRRRFQNEDGSLTPEGIIRYKKDSEGTKKKLQIQDARESRAKRTDKKLQRNPYYFSNRKFFRNEAAWYAKDEAKRTVHRDIEREGYTIPQEVNNQYAQATEWLDIIEERHPEINKDTRSLTFLRKSREGMRYLQNRFDIEIPYSVVMGVSIAAKTLDRVSSKVKTRMRHW